MRALRAHYFPDDIFAEYAWVMLLRAYLRGHDAAAAAPGDTVPPVDAPAMRHWRRYLEHQRLIEVEAADQGPTLTPEGLDRMQRYLDDLAQVADTLR